MFCQTQRVTAHLAGSDEGRVSLQGRGGEVSVKYFKTFPPSRVGGRKKAGGDPSVGVHRGVVKWFAKRDNQYEVKGGSMGSQRMGEG